MIEILMAAEGTVGGPAAPAGDAATAAVSVTPPVEGAPPSALADAAAPTPETVTPAEVTKVDAPKPEPSLLEAAAGKPKADAPKADTPAPEVKAEVKATPDPAADATLETPAPAPVKYEAFKLPEGLKLDDKKVSEFTEIIGARQIPQEEAQKLLDLYIADRQADAAAMQAEQRRVWDSLIDGWKTELRKDPQLGGNRLETTLSMAKAVIEEYGGSPEQVRELLAHTSNNGMGNFPGFVRLLHNIGKALNVFEDSIVPANAQPPKPAKTPGNRGWYDKSMGNGVATP